MARRTRARPGAGQYVRKLVETALGQDRLSGLDEMLKCIAQSLDADGCILWEATPDSGLDANPPTASLSALAQWFNLDRHWTTYKLQLSSVSGQAVLSNTDAKVDDARTDPRVDFNLPFFRRTDVKAFCCFPIRFQSGIRGAVNLYRVPARAFGKEEMDRGRELASLIPSLYQAIRDRVSFNLLRELDLLLQQAEIAAAWRVEDAETVRGTLDGVCRLVGDAFQARETSLFMEDRLSAPNRFDLAATTWPPFATKRSYERGEPGLTPWVLDKARSVRIFDLAYFQEDLPSLQTTYPGISWQDRNNVLATVRDHFHPRFPDEAPPASFMCSPIQTGDRLLGAIRCCTALRSPYYFAEREVSLLELAAMRIGQFWENWLRRREAEEENRSLRGLVDGVSAMNRRAQQELSRENPDERVIHEEASRIGRETVPGADLLGILVKSEPANEFEFSHRDGAAWLQIDEAEAAHLKSCVLQVQGGGAGWAGALAISTPPACRLVRHVIAAPLSTEGQVYGAMQIASIGEREFSKLALAIAGLLAEQVGLYHHLIATLGRSRQAQRELTRAAEQQKQTYEDLGHQMKTPVMTAYAKVDALLRSPLPDKVRAEVQILRAILSKAKTVSWSTQLFAQLAERGELEATLRPLNQRELLNVINTAASDQQQRLDASRDLVFRVLHSGFRILDDREVLADIELLEHAIQNLLDNAGKYSAPKSKVEIHAGVTAGDRFHITVRNKGLRIRSGDVRQCIIRGWRGEEARLVTGEGSGVGLWLAHHVMKALNGELMIVPTTGESITEARLILPFRARR